MKPIQLNSDLVGPETDEFDRIEDASGRVSDILEETFDSPHCKVHWSWGDSTAWRIILGVPTENDLKGLVSSGADAALATRLAKIIGQVVELNDGFQLFLELDSDERVKASEGWFFRLKSEPMPGREKLFVWNGERLESSVR